MPHLIADSTNRVTYTPETNLTACALAITKTNGSTVSYSGTIAEDASGNWMLDLQSAEITSALLYTTLTFTWTLTYIDSSGLTQIRTDIEYFDVLHDDSSSTVYGSIAGVQRYIVAVIFSSSSTPSTATVTGQLVEESAITDMRLTALGYSAPMTDATSVLLLGRLVELYVAADILERLIIGREPTPSKVETAETWRRKADEIWRQIEAGDIALGTVATSGQASTLSGISNATAIFSNGALDNFVDVYGSPFTLDESQAD